MTGVVGQHPERSDRGWSDDDDLTTKGKNNDDAERRPERHWPKMESAGQRPNSGKLEKSKTEMARDGSSRTTAKPTAGKPDGMDRMTIGTGRTKTDRWPEWRHRQRLTRGRKSAGQRAVGAVERCRNGEGDDMEPENRNGAGDTEADSN